MGRGALEPAAGGLQEFAGDGRGRGVRPACTHLYGVDRTCQCGSLPGGVRGAELTTRMARRGRLCGGQGPRISSVGPSGL